MNDIYLCKQQYQFSNFELFIDLESEGHVYYSSKCVTNLPYILHRPVLNYHPKYHGYSFVLCRVVQNGQESYPYPLPSSGRV